MSQSRRVPVSMVNHSIDVRCTVFVRLQSVEKLSSRPRAGILRDKTVRAGRRPAAERATEEVWTKCCPSYTVSQINTPIDISLDVARM